MIPDKEVTGRTMKIVITSHTLYDAQFSRTLIVNNTFLAC